MKENIKFITNQTSFYDSYDAHNIQLSSLDELEEWFKTRKEKYFAIDTETTAHDPYFSEILLVQIGDKDTQFVVDCKTVYPRKLLKTYLESSEWKKFLHNAKFDYKHIKHHWKIELNNVYDSFLVEMLIRNGLKYKGFGLKDIVQEYAGVSLDKEVRESFGKSVINFTIPQIKYAAADVRYFEAIHKEQKNLLEKNDLTTCAALENKVVLAYGDIELNGFGFDAQEWTKIAKEQELELIQLEKKLDNYIVEKSKEDEGFKKYVSAGIPMSLFPDMDLPVEKKGKKKSTHNRKQVLIEWSSPKQVLPIFHLHDINTNFTDVKTNETRESISGMILEKNQHNPFVKLYTEYKKVQKQVSSFGLSFLDNIHEKTGRIHTSFNQLRAETGRVSSSNPNLQQIPARSKIGERQRKCFIARSGYLLITADYSQAEIRIVADGANETGLIESLNRNEDPYGYAGTKMFGVPVSKTENKDKRDISKAIILGLNYGMGASKLATKLDCSIEEAKKYMDLFQREMPNIASYLNKLNKFGITRGYSITQDMFRRRRWYKLFKDALQQKQEGDSFALAKIGRESQNHPIQGGNANLTKLATILIRDYIKGSNVDAFIVNQVHDEIVVEVKEEIAEQTAKEIIDLMIQAGKIMYKKVIMSASYEINKSWSK